MGKRLSTGAVFYKEVAFQVVLHALVFIFFAFDRSEQQIESHKFVFFLQYAAAAFFINYVLLPRFYYQKKHWQFFVFVALTLAMVMISEEMVLEQIYYPGDRADSFPGVFFTLTQVLPPITILSGFKFAWDALIKQREVEELQSAVKESELQFLKTQINPHFLFNNLNNLYAYAIEHSPKTPEIILELSGVLRYMLYECKEEYVPLTKEIAQMKNFINLSEMQIEERGQVSFSSQGVCEAYQIAPLILIVFIENAFKHSTASQSENITIDVNLRITDSGILEFVCKNSYQTQSNTESLSQGIGLENVKKRLQLLYPNAHELKIKKGDEFYEVYLKMNLHKI